MLNPPIIENKKLSITSIEIKDYLVDYISKIKIDVNLYSIVFPRDFFKSGSLYLLFPLFFKTYLKSDDKEFLKKLCVASLFCFKYLISIDEVIDDDRHQRIKRSRNFNSGLKAFIYNQHSIKLLSEIFINKPTFWFYWSKRNEEYLKAIEIDTNYNPYMSVNEYYELAIHKCSFTRLAIDSIKVKSECMDEKEYTSLITAIDHLSIATCIDDDIEDFEKDLLNKKNNIGHILIASELGHEFLEMSTKSILDKFYSNNYKNKLYSLAIEQYDMALHIIEKISKDAEFINSISLLKNKTLMCKVNHNIDFITNHKYSHSENYIKRDPKEAINDGLSYIAHTQNNDGSWDEILNKAGISNVWASAFIALNTPQNSLIDFKKTSSFLLENSNDLMWYYNTDGKDLKDYDSTTCVLLFLSQNDISIEKYLENWADGSFGNGAFPTYASDNTYITKFIGREEQEDVKGWFAHHTCVSALAYYFLKKYKIDAKYTDLIKKLETYLFNNIGEDGLIASYWWTSNIYATYFFTKSLQLNKEKHKETIHATISFLFKKQNADGSFSCDLLQEKNVFYSAMVLDLVLNQPELKLHYHKEIELLIDWILSQQLENGSFKAGYVLAIPDPSSENRDNGKPYHKGFKHLGTQSIAPEVGGLFSTVMAVKALSNI